MQQHGKNMEIINEHEEGKGMLSNSKLQSGCFKAIDWFYRGNHVCCGPLASARSNLRTMRAFMLCLARIQTT
jgi:hypothetical protein